MPKVRRCRQYGCHAMAELPNHYCNKHIEHEQEYLESRMKWARSHENKHREHVYNTVIRNDKSYQYNFYRTKQWVNLRQQVLNRDDYMCQYCKAQSIFTPNSKTVDHIVPIEVMPSLMADEANLATICRKCHRLKTDWEQRYYGTGKDNQPTHNQTVGSVEMVARLMS